jgi:membrane associated rhomboid family serine protease
MPGDAAPAAGVRARSGKDGDEGVLPVVSHEVRTGRWPYVTVCLIGLNALALLFAVSLGPRFVPFLQQWGLVPARIAAEVTLHNVTTVATSTMLHVGVVHLLMNMWFLFVFGDVVEDALGPWWFLFLYLVSGFFGSMLYVATTGGSPVPAVGASGAVSGVMAASLVLWPKARLRLPGLLLLMFVASLVISVSAAAGVTAWQPLTAVVGAVTALLVVVLWREAGGLWQGLVGGIGVPAWLVLGLYIGLQLYSGLLVLVSPAFGASFGYWAHVGGFAAGATLAWLFPNHAKPLPGGAVGA